MTHAQQTYHIHKANTDVKLLKGSQSRMINTIMMRNMGGVLLFNE